MFQEVPSHWRRIKSSLVDLWWISIGEAQSAVKSMIEMSYLLMFLLIRWKISSKKYLKWLKKRKLKEVWEGSMHCDFFWWSEFYKHGHVNGLREDEENHDWGCLCGIIFRALAISIFMQCCELLKTTIDTSQNYYYYYYFILIMLL